MTTARVRRNFRVARLAVAAVAALVMMKAGAAGSELYQNYCASCHGLDGAGLAAFRGDLALFRARLAGTENMPDMSAVLTDDEIAQVFGYLMDSRTATPPR